ncbi:hypothetical protein OY671_008350, partial [Metschnikowia pulcherrima]
SSVRIAIGSMSAWGRLTSAAGTAGSVLVNLIAGDFAGRWEPIPATSPSDRPLAWLSGLALIACGVGLVRRTTICVSASTLGSFSLSWVVILHGLLVIAAPGDVRTWLYLGEVSAIACGVADGSQSGQNARAASISRGFAEMQRFGMAMGAQAETLSGSSGLGDSVSTCSSTSSRNFSSGKASGEGTSAAAASADRATVAEGAFTAPVSADLARSKGISMPIVEAVAA